jgi:hypothetical protein
MEKIYPDFKIKIKLGFESFSMTLNLFDFRFNFVYFTIKEMVT